MSEKRKYDSTVARIAGNIAGGLIREEPGQWGVSGWDGNSLSVIAVSLARAIVAEVERTEPETPSWPVERPAPRPKVLPR